MAAIELIDSIFSFLIWPPADETRSVPKSPVLNVVRAASATIAVRPEWLHRSLLVTMRLSPPGRLAGEATSPDEMARTDGKFLPSGMPAARHLPT